VHPVLLHRRAQLTGRAGPSTTPNRPPIGSSTLAARSAQPEQCTRETALVAVEKLTAPAAPWRRCQGSRSLSSPSRRLRDHRLARLRRRPHRPRLRLGLPMQSRFDLRPAVDRRTRTKRRARTTSARAPQAAPYRCSSRQPATTRRRTDRRVWARDDRRRLSPNARTYRHGAQPQGAGRSHRLSPGRLVRQPQRQRPRQTVAHHLALNHQAL
jgi:hypothetical protein